MTRLATDEVAAAIRAIKIEAATREAAWLLSVRHHLRRHGPSTTHDLAQAAGMERGRYFGRFRLMLDQSPCIVRAGTALGPTGHLNNLWALTDA